MNPPESALSYNELKAFSEFQEDRDTFFKRGALLRVPLDPSISDESVRELVDALSERHPLLRTSYHPNGSGAAPVVHPSYHHAIRVADACAYPVDGLYPDHLEPEDLVRIWLTPGESGRILFYDMNEIITDTGSTARLSQDVNDFLDAPGGPAVPAGWQSPLDRTYRDFAADQRSAAVPAGHLDYWQSTLAQLPPTGTIPDEGPDPSGDTAGERVWMLPDHLTATFRGLCRQHRASGFMAAVGLVSLTFAALWDIDDVVTATAGSMRPGDFGEVLGNFNNNVILRQRVPADTPISQVIDDARTVVLGALRHPVHHLKLAELLTLSSPAPVRIHYLTADAHYHTLLDSKPSDAEWVEPAEFPGWPLEVGFAEDRAHRLAIWLQYDPRRFTHHRVATILQGLRLLLTAIAEGGDPTAAWLSGHMPTTATTP